MRWGCRSPCPRIRDSAPDPPGRSRSLPALVHRAFARGGVDGRGPRRGCPGATRCHPAPREFLGNDRLRAWRYWTRGHAAARLGRLGDAEPFLRRAFEFGEKRGLGCGHRGGLSSGVADGLVGPGRKALALAMRCVEENIRQGPEAHHLRGRRHAFLAIAALHLQGNGRPGACGSSPRYGASSGPGVPSRVACSTRDPSFSPAGRRGTRPVDGTWLARHRFARAIAAAEALRPPEASNTTSISSLPDPPHRVTPSEPAMPPGPPSS